MIAFSHKPVLLEYDSPAFTCVDLMPAAILRPEGGKVDPGNLELGHRLRRDISCRGAIDDGSHVDPHLPCMEGKAERTAFKLCSIADSIDIRHGCPKR